MDVFIAFFLFLAALALIIKGCGFLVGAAIRLNAVTGLSKVAIGATFIAVATTAPEIFILLISVMRGNHDLAVGSAIGSMIANIALVLALYMAFLPSRVDRKDIISKSLFLLAVLVFVFIFSLNGSLNFLEGIFLILAFTLFILTVGRGKQGPAIKRHQKTPFQTKMWIKIVAGALMGQALMMGGAFLLVNNAERLSELMGLSHTVIGFTVVALGTAAPELATVIIAIRRKSGDLALGSILGANVIGSTLLLGLSGLVVGAEHGSVGISNQILWVSLPILLGATLAATIPMMLRGRTYRWQGIVLVAVYAAYIIFLVTARV